MKTMKGRILNKLKSIPQMQQLKQSRILQLKASSDGFFFNSPPPPTSHLLDCRDHPQIMDEVELMRDFDDDEDEEDKENIKPASTKTRSPIPWRKQNNDEHNHKFHPYRRPNLNSPTLFDPNLLAAFEQAVKDYFRFYELWKQMEEKMEKEEVEPPLKIPKISDILKEFDEKCPPGGTGTVIFYSTSLRGVRKTFDGCSAIRFLLESSKVMFYERDVSIHKEFREELKRLLGFGAIPPRLFVDGRYIGGAEEVLGLHEQGRLMPVLKELPRDQSGGVPCWRCGGAKFLVCERCDGGHKMYDEVGGVWGDCNLCNENGLVVCPLCCS